MFFYIAFYVIILSINEINLLFEALILSNKQLNLNLNHLKEKEIIPLFEESIESKKSYMKYVDIEYKGLVNKIEILINENTLVFDKLNECYRIMEMFINYFQFIEYIFNKRINILNSLIYDNSLLILQLNEIIQQENFLSRYSLYINFNDYGYGYDDKNHNQEYKEFQLSRIIRNVYF